MFLERLRGLVGALWSGARTARIILLVVLLPLLGLFHGPIRGWLHQPIHLPHLRPNVIDFLTLYLAVSGILYAIIHEIQLGEHVRRLRGIEGSLSTRRLGRFPHHLGEIAKLLDGSKRLRILADCADYGSFFAPEEHEVLHDAVFRFSKAEGHQVQILVAGPPAPLTSASSWAVDEYMQRFPAIKKQYWSKYIKNRSQRPALSKMARGSDGRFGESLQP